MVNDMELKYLVVSTALELVAEHGRQAWSMREVAEQTGLSLTDLHAILPLRAALLPALTEVVEQAMLEEVGTFAEFTEDENKWDRLFALLMRRFDALNPYKPAMRVLQRDLRRDPLAALWGISRLVQSMTLTLEAAGGSNAGAR